MSVVWAATALETGWFSGLERHSTVQELKTYIKALSAGLGQGYLEIRRPDDDLPYLALGFKADHAVLHLFDNSGGVSLHVGEDASASGAEVEVMIMDELYAFTADVALTIDHAWDIVLDFIQTRKPGELGNWYQLQEGLDRQLRHRLRHLVGAELGWFCLTFDREGAPLPFEADVEGDEASDQHVAAHEPVKDILDFYARARAASGEAIESLDIDAATVSRRWAVIHMIEEVARHAGHADILRESIDGFTRDHNWG